VFRLW